MNASERRRCARTGFYPPVTYVLLDDQFIEKSDGLQRVHGPVQKLPDPVMTADRPWEGDFVWSHSGLIYDQDEKIFKFWYHAHDPTLPTSHPVVRWDSRPAYATSTDCLKWDKPELGIVSWKGSKRNNFVRFPPYGGAGPLTSVFKNPHPGERGYLAMGMARFQAPRGMKPMYWLRDGGYRNERKRRTDIPIACGFFVYDSPDGFVWKRRQQMLMSNAICTDNVFVQGFDHHLNKWIVFAQARTADKFRTMGVSFCDDLEFMPFPQEALTPDEDDPPGCQFNHMVAAPVPGGYAGLVVDYRPHEGCKKEPQLVFSRDARHWARTAGRKPFIPAGPRGSWDEMNVFVHNPVVVGDDIFIMYHGSITGNGSNFPDHRRGRTRYIKVGGWGTELPDGRLNLPGLGLAKLKRDRWAALTPVRRSGTLHTRRMYWAGRELRINADAGDRGSIRAELRDHHGKPVPGFTFKESDPFTGDRLDTRMSWKCKRLLPASYLGSATSQGTIGRMMSIRFRLDQARLYTFSC